MADQKPVKIAVFGSAKEPGNSTWLGWPDRERALAEELGFKLGDIFGDKIEILTGACVGVPAIVARNARRYGTRVIGYSGEQTIEEHIHNPNYENLNSFDELKLINPNERVLNGLSERSLRMIKDGDAFVYLGGRTGTLLEYLMAFDGTDKPMYVLRGSGGIVDRIPRLGIKKQRKAGMVYETDSVFDLASRLDRNFGICNFQNDPNILIVKPMSQVSWVQFAYGYEPDHNKKVILMDN
jgi:predicted Rossmann-fold nucleotide-binding protein